MNGHQPMGAPAPHDVAGLGAVVVDTDQFTQALAALNRTYRGWKTAKEGTFIMLTGPSGAGKTTVADCFVEDLGKEWSGEVTDGDAVLTDPTGPVPATVGVTKLGPEGVVRPLVKVFVAPKARARDLLRDLLRALGVRAAHHDTFGELMTQLEIHIVGQKVRMIIFDEVHHIVERQGSTTAYEAAEVIKMLLLQPRTQVACIGLPHAQSIIEGNPELPRHLRGRYSMDALFGDAGDPESEYMIFLAGLSEELPFAKPCRLDEPVMAMRLHVATRGYVGQIVNLVQEACTLAIEDGLSTLTNAKLADAFAAIEGLGVAENPFLIPDCDEATYAPIRDRVETRRRQADVLAGRSRKTSAPARERGSRAKPDFKK